MSALHPSTHEKREEREGARTVMVVMTGCQPLCH